jgi:hypothetical protein
LKNSVAKITLIILIGIIYSGCNAVKRVPKDENLLTKNEIIVDGKKTTDEAVSELLYQKPNSSILGYKLRLNLFNLAKQNPDSAYKAKFLSNPKKYKRQSALLSAKQVARKGQSFFYSGIHNFLKRTGEAPVIIDEARTQKSLDRLESYYFNNGYFKADAKYKIDTVGKQRAEIKYTVTKGPVSKLDSLTATIYTPALDSLYQRSKANSFLKTGAQFRTENFEAERDRITNNFRNRGAFYFQQSNILFNIDTVGTGNKTNVEMVINDQSVRENDSATTRPFKLYKISRVNIFTDLPSDKNQAVADSAIYNNFNLYSYKKIKYRPKAITDAVFITKDSTYSDIRTSLTSRYLSNLKIFNHPGIQYKVDENDPEGNSLIANILLSPKKKYHFNPSLDFTHSNIQDFGISATTSVTIRNVFNGAETLEIAARGNIGSSKDMANPNNVFFNITEYGIDTKLNFPRMVTPINIEKIIPKRMLPSTSLNFGFAKQRNIGLDKENFTGSMTYNWTPKRYYTSRFDLFNVQYVNNINVDNYFNVYRSSFVALNDLAKKYNADPTYFDPNPDIPFESRRLIIASGTTDFTRDVLKNGFGPAANTADYKTIRSIEERRKRLTENNLILASSYSFSKTTKTSLSDNTFYIFRTKVESAGNVLSLFATASKTIDSQDSKKTILGIVYSQYFKTEFEYIKHWDLSRERVVAFRTLLGMAIPYGNSDDIPFSRSYFAGGSNDIRAWQPYSLGPGSSAAINDFNEANLKLTISAELRFKILNALKGGLFVDAGNIWNAFGHPSQPGGTFDNLASLENIAVGSGFGLRYDLSFFVIRIDMGFKTYNPADTSGKKWFRDYNFGNSVLNIGINYPF